MPLESDNCFQTLSFEQVEKLNDVLQKSIEVHGRGNFPTLDITVRDLIQRLLTKISEKGVPVKDVRLNGSAASYVLGDSDANELFYNDIDLIFSIQPDNDLALLKMKDMVTETLLEFFPQGTNRERLSTCALTDAYVSKLTKVWQPNGDKWSLVTLSNYNGMNLELKFVDTMKRQFQFSVDSFQIILDSMVQFYQMSSEPMSPDFYPTVTAESVYGEFCTALHHLNHRLIVTRSPQEIRGGGLLKYCELLSRGFIPEYTLAELETVERLMCSRFFIDYPTTAQQYQKIYSYLNNHFCRDYASKVSYLEEVYRVVDNSTVCLMGRERRQVLDLIRQMTFQVYFESQRQHSEIDFCLLFEDKMNTFVVQEIFYQSPTPSMHMCNYSTIASHVY